MRMWQGASGYSPYSGILSPAYTVITPNEGINSEFFAYQFKQYNMIQTFKRNSQGLTSDTWNLKFSALGSIKINVPSFEEQTKIAEFLKCSDTLITLHQRKLDRLKQMKQGYLQQMFPKNGESVPRLRFADFYGEWEQRKLGEVAEFNPKSILPDKFEYVDLESVIETNLISHRTETKESAPSRAQRLARKGDVFYQTVRPYQKNNYLFNLSYNNYVFSTGYTQMRPYVDSNFLLGRLQEERFVKNVLDRCTGTSYPAINSNDLADIEIKVPVIKKEQIQIGLLFMNLDHLITLHQSMLDRLKSLKKVYLQKMFT